MFKPFSLNLKGRLRIFDRPAVMGIVNVTSDSFFSSSRAASEKEVYSRVESMLRQGVDIIDLGGVSTRPGSHGVDEDTEMQRVELGLKAIRSLDASIPVSVDTYRSAVARFAVEECQADIINDISGGIFDPRMFDTIAQLKVPYILCHTPSMPEDMQMKCDYDDVTAEVIKSLSTKLRDLHLLGVSDVIVDPGFGFGKTVDQNYRMISELQAFSVLNSPILVGISRKSMITAALGVSMEEALTGTIALNSVALMNGASIIRVHDVKEALQVVKIVRLCDGESRKS